MLSLWDSLYLVPLFSIGVAFLLILIKKRRENRAMAQLDRQDKIESLANPIAITAILFFTLIYATFISPFRPIMPYPLNLVTVVWYVLFLIVFLVLCLREHHRYKGPPQEEKDEKDLTLKYELIRKVTHATILLIVLCYIALGPLVMSILNWILSKVPFLGAKALNVNPIYYGQYSVVFLTVIAFLGLATSEIVRVFFYRSYPLKSVKVIFRQKEIGASLGSHISLAVGCMATIIFFGPIYPDIVMASISISAIADGAASIIGRRFGRHGYTGALSRKRKTFEGLLSATIVSFALSLIFLVYRFGIYSLLIAFVATGVLDLIDWLSPQISDNLLNPVLTSWAMVFVAGLLTVAGLIR
jgi:dolichol kinase